MEQLQYRLPDIDIKPTDSYGVDSDYIEAMIFAWLAKKRLDREKINLKTCNRCKKEYNFRWSICIRLKNG